jgi:hypothetical protein
MHNIKQAETILQMQLMGKLHEGQGGLLGMSPLRSDGSRDAVPRERWPKATQGGPSGPSPLGSDGSCDG